MSARITHRDENSILNMNKLVIRILKDVLLKLNINGSIESSIRKSMLPELRLVMLFATGDS